MVGICSLGDGGCISVTNAQRLITYREAIEYLEGQKSKTDIYVPTAPNRMGINWTINGIISLLQQGEAYEKMWEALSAWHNKSGIGNLSEAIEDLEQKYFPKEEPK